MAKPYVSVVIPAYNEQRRLPKTLLEVDKYLSDAEYSYEIIVVDDASTDGTGEMINQFSEHMKQTKALHNEKNCGKGCAVKKGMLAARGSIRLFMDADNATPINHFDSMIPLFKSGADVVIGSRTHKDSELSPPQSLIKRVLGKLGNLFIQILVLPGMWDTQCGFKAFSEESAENIFLKLRVSRWGFDVEALALAKKGGYKIREIPVHWSNDEASKVGGAGYLRTLLDVVKIRFNLWFNKYKFNK